jgi:hypothetical protein
MIYVPVGRVEEVRAAVEEWGKLSELMLKLSWINLRELGLGRKGKVDDDPGFTSA